MLFEVFLRTQEHDPRAIIECKQIAGADTHLCREYVVEGLDRLATGKYGAAHAVGFMVGYVLSGTPSESAGGVNAYLTRTFRNHDYLMLKDVCSDSPSWESQHGRKKPSSPIKLHHAFNPIARVAAA
jgi:hypothetical protein